MGIIPIINVVQNDTKPFLQFTILTDGQATNITGAVIRFKLRKAGATTNVNSGVDTCDILDATNGICEYKWKTADLAEAGDYEGEVEVTFSDGKIQTQFPKYIIKVRPQL
jgi:hypothetical protein